MFCKIGKTSKEKQEEEIMKQKLNKEIIGIDEVTDRNDGESSDEI